MGAGQLVLADGQQAALLLENGDVFTRTYIIFIYEGVARRGMEREVEVKGGVVAQQMALHRPLLAVGRDPRLGGRHGVGLAAFHLVPPNEIARVVGLEGNHQVGAPRNKGREVRGEVTGVALQALAPAEAGEMILCGGAHHLLAGQQARLGMALAEGVPAGGAQVGRAPHVVHQPGHHHAVGLHAHAAGADVAAQQPRAVGGGELAVANHLIGPLLQHQRVGIAQHAGHGAVAGELVVEEQAPVVAIGHGQLAVAQSQPPKDAVADLAAVVEEEGGRWSRFSRFGR